MTPQQGVLALVRDSDPRSSREGARRANVTSQRARILRHLWHYDRAFGAAVSSVDADRLHAAFPETQRSVWSTRLSAMCRAGLLVCPDREASPLAYRLTDEGRRQAAELSR